MSWIEIWSVTTGIIYIALAARENIWCWLFGIISSLLSIYLFFLSKLYAESMLYFYYVIAGIYGWVAWSNSNKKGETLKISIWPWVNHLLVVPLGVALSFLLAWFLQNYTDAELPLIDAHTTVFSFIATYMTARKILSNWIYWIIIDFVSIGLYVNRELYLYSGLMVIYTGMAVYAFFNWNAMRKSLIR